MSFKKRRLNIAPRMVLFTLPVLLLAILIIIFTSYSYLYRLREDRISYIDTSVRFFTIALTKTLSEYKAGYFELINNPEIHEKIDGTEEFIYNDEQTERFISDFVNKHHLNGITYIVNRRINTTIEGQTYSYRYWGSSDSLDNDFKMESFINLDDLFTASMRFVKDGGDGMILGRPSQFTLEHNSAFSVILMPIETGDYEIEVFALTVIQNEGEGSLFDDIVSKMPEYLSINNYILDTGTIYIKDLQDNTLYSNWGGRYIDPKWHSNYRAGKVANFINNDENILKSAEMEAIINSTAERSGQFKTLIDSVVYNDISFRVFSDKSNELKNCGLKVVYLLPELSFYFQYIDIYRNTIILLAVVLVLFSVFLSILIGSVLKPVYIINDVSKRISQGNLDLNVASNSKDEIGMLYSNFNSLIAGVNNVIANVQLATNTLAGYESSLDNVINNFDQTINKQASSIKEGSKTFEMLSKSIKEVSRYIKETTSIATQAENHSKESGKAITEMGHEIKLIADTTDQINQITELINGISEKTRLLSLNAAIEASRAGETGKGFSVVAGEIRKLAQQSNEAAGEIGSLIKMNEKRIKSGANKVREVVDAISRIDQSIGLIIGLIEQINKVTEMESNDSIVLMDTLNNISEEANKSVNIISILTRTKNQLTTEVTKTRDMVLSYKLSPRNKQIIYDTMKYKLPKIEKQKKVKVKSAKTIVPADTENLGNLKGAKKTTNSDRKKNRGLNEYKPKNSLFRRKDPDLL